MAIYQSILQNVTNIYPICRLVLELLLLLVSRKMFQTYVLKMLTSYYYLFISFAGWLIIKYNTIIIY